ncbi:MAG TPA: universal stress protein [Gaiellaceae bacterium]|jgi:APA family basic amino acid/polyamine antiporter
MARKIPGLSRAIDFPALAAVAYGEIGSSVYFALGIVAFYALGLTPWVLLAVGLAVFAVALLYAEGVAALPEPGGASAFVRRAFNDQAGFATGWLIFLDYLIVIALAALFVPHYLGAALEVDALTHGPWDVTMACCVIAVVAATRLAVRRRSIFRLAIGLAVVAVVTQAFVVIAGLVLLGPGEALTHGIDLGSAPSWSDLAFALPAATLAYTGLETVANFAAETREPGKSIPRSLFAALGAVVVVTTLVAVVGIAAFPVQGTGASASTELATTWGRAPLVGIVTQLPFPAGLVDVLRGIVGVTGALVLIAAVTTSISGAGRLAHNMARLSMIPRAFGRLTERSRTAPATLAAATVLGISLLLGARAADDPARMLASLYSFGVLIALAAGQLAVVRLRFTEPELERPFKAPGNIRIRGTPVPVIALVGVPLTLLLLAGALATHNGARIAGPIWLLLGFVVFVAVRISQHEDPLGRYEPVKGDLVPGAEGVYERILVPVKIGPIGDELLGAALRLAEEREALIRVVNVIRVPMDLPLDAALEQKESDAHAAIREAAELCGEHGVMVEGEIVRARSIGEAIVETAGERDAELILLGSAPRWRRQARFFSPTVDYVLRHAPCEVMVVAYPEGVLDEEPEE